MQADRNANVLNYLACSAERFPDRPALIFGAGAATDRLTFRQLWERAVRLGSGFAKAGLAPGERAIVMIPMSPNLYAALFGVLAAGGTAVFVDPWIARRQIAAFSAFAKPSAFVGIGKSHLLRWLDEQLRRTALTVTTSFRFGPFPARRTLDEIESRGSSDRPIEPVTADDPALITFTSGSSGVPKGANRTHGFLAAQHQALAQEFPYLDDDVDMPMFPVFALNNLAIGIPSVIPTMDFRHVDRIDADLVLDQMARHDVTTATASPPFFDRLVDRLIDNPQRRPRLRRILTGGAPVSDRQLTRWLATFPETEIVVVYGSTEAEPVAHISARERLKAAAEDSERGGYCVGRPSPQVETRLAPITTGELAGDHPALDRFEIGELLVTGNHVCKDYFRNPEAVRENKWRAAGGTVWHRMGDTGYFDEAGRFWLVGRVHSTIWRAGVAIHPQILEQVIAQRLSAVPRAAAVGLPDSQLGQRVALILEPPSERFDPAELLALAERHLQDAGHCVDELRLASEPLPLDPRHKSKVDYGELRRRLLEEKPE